MDVWVCVQRADSRPRRHLRRVLALYVRCALQKPARSVGYGASAVYLSGVAWMGLCIGVYDIQAVSSHLNGFCGDGDSVWRFVYRAVAKIFAFACDPSQMDGSADTDQHVCLFESLCLESICDTSFFRKDAFADIAVVFAWRGAVVGTGLEPYTHHALLPGAHFACASTLHANRIIKRWLLYAEAAIG